MPAKWSDRDVSHLLADLEEQKFLERSGKAAFSNANFHIILSVVRFCIEITDDLTEQERKQVIMDGFWDTANTGEINKQRFITKVNRAIKKHRAKPETSYTVVTNLSISNNVRVNPRRVRGYSITFPFSLESELRDARNAVLPRWERSLNIQEPRGYRYVKVSGVKARSRSAAMQEASDALDLLRGTWKFYKNRSVPWRVSKGKRQPVNAIIHGPFWTIHTPSGETENDKMYYEPDFTEVRPLPLTAMDARRIRYNEKVIRRQLTRSTFRSEVEAALIRYAQALDHGNWELSFLKLWGLLERLTNTVESRGYGPTIKRASFLWDDHENSRLILEQLRKFRNKWVHTQAVTEEMEHYLYHLKNHVERLIGYHWATKFPFDSFEESCRVLDLPPGAEDLKRRRKLVDLALGYKS